MNLTFGKCSAYVRLIRPIRNSVKLNLNSLVSAGGLGLGLPFSFSGVS